MRYIEIPEDIVVRRLDNNEPIFTAKFTNFVRDTLLTDAQFGVDLDAVMAAKRIYDALCATTANSGLLKLTPADAVLLTKVMQKPTGGYRPGLALQYTNFMLAILEHKPCVQNTTESDVRCSCNI